MNERIEKLARQAREQTEEFNSVRNKLTVEEWTEIYNEKFAELIVAECVDQVWYTREDMINENISEVIKLRIKEHFGVEE